MSTPHRFGAVSPDQVASVRRLQAKHRLPAATLDVHCRARFGRPVADLGRRDVSALIDEMVGWNDAPAELRIACGQAVLSGFE